MEEWIRYTIGDVYNTISDTKGKCKKNVDLCKLMVSD